MTNHLYELIRSHMPPPERLFAETDDGRRYAYRDVEELSARYAHALVELGVRPGDRVAAQVEDFSPTTGFTGGAHAIELARQRELQQAAGQGAATGTDDFRAVAPPVMSFASGRRR